MSCFSFVNHLKSGNQDVAAVFFDDQAPYIAYERKNREPHSAVTRLIQILTAGRRGSTMGGKTIYTTLAQPTDMDYGMADLFGMRIINWEDNVATPAQARADRLTNAYQPPTFQGADVKCGAGVNLSLQNDTYKKIHRLYLMAAFAVVSGKLSALSSKSTEGHSIGAILVHKDGSIAAWSTSTNLKNKSQHAEVNLIQSYFARYGVKQLPEGAHIYSTLKPCIMCAGMIVSCAGSSYRVIYGQDDVGNLAQNTALDRVKTSELIGSAISGQLHLVKANFATKGWKGERFDNQAAGAAKTSAQAGGTPRGKVDLAQTLHVGYQSHQATSGGGVTGYLDEYGGHAMGVIGSVADRLAAKIGKSNDYYKGKYGDDTAILAVIRHIEAYLNKTGILPRMQW